MSRKPRKRYHPRKHKPDSQITPLDIARLRHSRQPLSDHDISNISAPLADFIAALKNGSCTQTHYWHAIENNYLFVRLIQLLQNLPQLNANEAKDFKVRLLLSQAEHNALDVVGIDVIEAIGQRQQQRGHFIATGTELNHLQTALHNYRSVLGAIEERHYFAAWQTAEHALQVLAHKRRVAEAEARRLQLAFAANPFRQPERNQNDTI